MRLCLVTTLTTLVLTAFSFVPIFSHAQTLPCGTITAPANWQNNFDPSDPLETNPITDCQNPFGVTDAGPSPDTLFIAANQVFDTNVIEIPTVTTSDYNVRYDYSNRFISHQAILFKHADANYQYVSIEQLPPTEEDYRLLATEFFTDPNDIDDAVQRIMSDDPWAGLEYGSAAFTKIDNFDRFVRINLPTKLPPLNLGTYTLVFKLGELFPTWHQTLLKKFTQFFVLVAYAASPGTYKITFTLKNPTPSPAGASSVLFLPGIQASRLYVGEDGPDGSAFERVWEPGNNSDVRALAMNQLGESIQKLYSTDILKAITTDLLFGYQYESGSVYQGFSNFMDEQVNDETIREWYPFAYDWRYDVFDIVKNGNVINQAGVRQYPATIAQELAQRSKSGKVTIIAHSNGGLLAKALMIELEKIGKGSLVDKIVFLGTPQMGTPKALGVILHGYDQEQGGGVFIKDTTARTVLNNFPGAYALLPSIRYLSQTDTPVVSFDNSASTALYRSAYGSSISSLEPYQNFLNGTVAENRSLSGKIYQPVGANSSLLAKALSNHANLLDSWIAPSSTKIISIIGTGIPTMKALRYEDVLETICPAGTTFSTLALCALERLPRPFAQMTYFGDKTVTGLSAKGYAGTGDKYFVDLKQISRLVPNEVFNHANFTETTYVQSLLANLISTTTVPTIPFIINQEPVVIEPYIVQQIASPVHLSSIDSSGRVSGYTQQNGTWVLKEDIPGSQYFEFAGVKYLLIPSDTDFKTTLSGQEFGGYTYKISKLKNDDTQITLSQLVNASTSPTMTATLEMTNGQFSTIKTDYNGDALIDSEVTVNGVVVTPQPLYSYQKLINTIQTLSIKKSQKDALLFLAREAEKFDVKSATSPLAGRLEKVTLRVLETTIQLYLKSRVLTPVQAEELLKIVKFLSQ